ncbi:RAMP superfamily CRISPR-associated protein [Arthrospira platensis]|uniref:Cmr6 family CRISPR-associated RAMP protein n=1 Tax=Limnospira platensis NIES-46 TaxID=1236695 RepID=A0A5M3TCX4_LIMPL|nr:RAMP superfamily CRISPR-associated protein [Arthrospira platensis]MDF2210466.1 RAMP superfamily CRISPR-associated protein [Arthrospira platensis NCB002]MDT9184290.1 RAMP superfamily CRISPR-associated protein [Limnospira sp. PMC 289.06]MDT9296440.1 RAMP superfamily CRISPR-associated protein [Arthrospira platensis PCC 7345]MDT9312137.1 RAMP superfamily CRISPR-associated protein [Limnospira sp. Paracas R14]WAK74580.1 RAMP superfamily CRISPR-associated protein [Arthrospira sp. PCC 9108]BDT1301
MVFEGPKPPNKANSRPNATPRPNPQQNRPNRGGNAPRRPGNGGGNRGRNGGGNGDNRPPQPSPWLDSENEPEPDDNASFVEYMRWMRSPDHPQKDGTKTQILPMAEDSANYNKRLSLLTERTKLIAGKDNCFQVRCSWRIRVSGYREPESILLPAFDALGMPYIPSSTLRGVARTQAIREIMKRDKIEWQEAEKKIAPYFALVLGKLRNPIAVEKLSF